MVVVIVLKVCGLARDGNGESCSQQLSPVRELSAFERLPHSGRDRRQRRMVDGTNRHEATHRNAPRPALRFLPRNIEERGWRI